MKKIICVGDFLYNSENQYKTTLTWLFELFQPIISNVINNAEITFDIINKDLLKFSREHFFQLNGQTSLNNSYNQYNVEDFNENQIDYLKQFFDENTIVLGFELYKPLTILLSTLGCTVIDFAFHSYKLFDDLAFGISTTNKEIYNKLLKYQIPQEKFYYYANYWKIFMKHNKLIQDDDIKENSVLFIGQTLKDKSVEKDGKFLNVTDFTDKINELAKQYNAVYYLPHPYMNRNRQIVYNYIKRNPNIELIKNRSTYGLLASNKVKKVVAISTSVLYEAQYFGKEIEYLYKPLFNIDAPFEEHSYVSIHEDYWNPKFWADILSPVCDVKNEVKDINYFKGANNKLRNIRDLYWGYSQLDPLRRQPKLYDSIKNLYFDFVALFKK